MVKRREGAWSERREGGQLQGMPLECHWASLAHSALAAVIDDRCVDLGLLLKGRPCMAFKATACSLARLTTGHCIALYTAGFMVAVWGRLGLSLEEQLAERNRGGGGAAAAAALEVATMTYEAPGPASVSSGGWLIGCWLTNGWLLREDSSTLLCCLDDLWGRRTVWKTPTSDTASTWNQIKTKTITLQLWYMSSRIA